MADEATRAQSVIERRRLSPPPDATPGTAGARLVTLATRTLAPILLILLLAVYAVLLGRLLSKGVDNFAIAGVFSTDEELSGRIVDHMLGARTANPSHFFAYGALYHEVSAPVLAPFVPLGLGERGVLVGLRAVALAGGVATLALTYLLGRRLYGAWAGLLAATLLALSAELAAWSVTAHPDTLQLAFITASLLSICALRRSGAQRDLLLSAALAGLAFSTKYVGVLLLPVIVLSAACALAERGWSLRSLARRLAGDAALAGAVFLAVFVATNPYAVVEWRRFLTQFRAEVRHAQTGHVLVENAGTWDWLTLLAEPAVAGPLVLLAALVGWGGALAAVAQSGRGPRMSVRRLATVISPGALVALWTAGYLLYLLLLVRYHAPRYLLPVLPGLVVSAAGAVSLLASRHRRAGVLVGLALLALSAALALPPLRDLYAERSERVAAREQPTFAAGFWLEEQLTTGAAVVSDAYVYLPDSLEKHPTFGLTAAQVRSARPVVIVTNEAIRGRFRDPAAADRYVDGADAYHERARTYEQLERNELGCYRLLQDFGPVKVYGDADALRARATHGCGAGS